MQGNAGKYRNYDIILVEGKTIEGKSEKIVKLGDFLDRPEIDQKYPHTVGYFKVSSGEKEDFKPEYLELREIKTLEDFWLFLNSVDI
jgi:hypothetical protein